MNSSIDFTLYGDEVGIFLNGLNLNGYDIIMAYSSSDVTFRTFTELPVVPSALLITSGWRTSTMYYSFISRVPQDYTGTPFESTDQVYFGEFM
jgi:hypothetical protein